jgi:hypothetical protein
LAALGLVTGAAAPVETKFDENRAWKFLVDQVEIGPRFPSSPGHLKCRDYIRAEAAKHADRVTLQPFSHQWSRGGRLEMWNVVAEQNWQNAKVRVLLCAHWDTRPSAEMDPDPTKRAKPILGANDGGSGVAVLLELMRVLKGLHPDLGIQYVFFDGEDLGPSLDEMFLGATHYAGRRDIPRPDYGILLDMVGDKDLRIPREPNSDYYAPAVMDALYAHAKTAGFEKTFPNVLGPEVIDDHIPLNRAGIPTVDLIDFTYPAWHTHQDTLDKCSAESLGIVGRFLETWFRKNPLWTPKPK